MGFNTKKSQEGYLLIDHSFSPGTSQVREGAKFESATITCSHCNSVVVLNPDRSRERHYCFYCDHYICDACDFQYRQTGNCASLKKTFDKLEKEILENGKVVL